VANLGGTYCPMASRIFIKYLSSLSIDRFFLDKVKLEICPSPTFTEDAKIAVFCLL
jgi:hypothetical protein